MITQKAIAQRTGLDISSVNKILNCRQGPVFRKKTIRKVFKVAREMGYDFNRIKFRHFRRHPRKPVSIAAEFAIYKKDGSLYDRGRAVIRDLSLCGACVEDIDLSQGHLPLEPFSVGLKPEEKLMENVEISGRIVRIHVDGVGSFGIEFQKVDPAVQRKLRKAIGN